ncbi:MAG: CHASE domain-containing protein [Thermomonas sp.]|uniref:CHASE domain-containing protein n=1 Tax=Thermomonas sp. TaxID=1971895 RepID=UPI0039E59134
MSSTTDATAPATTARHWWRGGHVVALLVLALSLLLVFLAWSQMRKRELGLAEEQFRGSAGRQAALVQLHLNNIELTLRGGASLFTAVEQPTPQHWRGYVDGLQLQSRFPSLLGLGYAINVDAPGLARLQEEWRDAGYGLLQLRPHGQRERYGPILYMAPETQLNLGARGFDMYSEPVRRQAMQAAMDSGEPRLSASLVLMRDASHPMQSLVFYTPVYAGPVAANVQARRAAMRGWVFAPFRIDTMLDGALQTAPMRLPLRLVDVTSGNPVVLYQDAGVDAEHAFTHSLTRPMYGRQWRFEFHSGPHDAAAPQLAALDSLLYAGIATSLLLFALVWSLASVESRARRLAARMTDSYRLSEQRFRSAIHFSAIGKALLDSHGNIVECNPALAKIVGRDAEALAGQMFDGLLDDGDTAADDAQAEEGGVTRQTRSLRRSDGETRHVQLTYAPVPHEPGIDLARLVQVEDVTERLRAEADVLALNRTLEARVAARTRELSEANRALEAFAYSVSHDLRAPLRGIEGFSRLLSEQHAAQLDDTGRDYLDRVRRGTARMGDLIEALLTLARIGRSEPQLDDINLTELAEEVAAGLADADPQRRVQVSIAADMQAQGDRALLRNLLENLMGNAWKFTRDRADARIEVGQSRDDEGHLWFHVADNGAGFDPDYAGKLFKPFQRLHSQEDFPGHGIGLASVKRIVERHGGEIRAEGSPGQGATFRFTLGAVAGEDA